MTEKELNGVNPTCVSLKNGQNGKNGRSEKVTPHMSVNSYNTADFTKLMSGK